MNSNAANLTDDQKRYLSLTIEEAKLAMSKGNTPFGAILVSSSGEVLITGQNSVAIDKDVTAHAELVVIKEATVKYNPNFLWKCTLYASNEPCAMCAAAIFLANIGTVIFAMSVNDLLALVAEKKTNDKRLRIESRDILSKGDNDINVIGPVSGFAEEVKQIHVDYLSKI